MGTSYLDIYKRAITEFKDPSIKKLFYDDEILFCQVMYNFLENAISMFITPIKASVRVQNRKEPYICSGTFVGDGISIKFNFEDTPEQDDAEDLLFKFTVNGENVKAKYDLTNNIVEFDVPPELNSDIEVTVYNVGSFNLKLYDGEIYVLSQLLLSCWSEYINNDVLDIQRLLGDTTFKLTSNATTTTAKVGWNTVNREVAIKRMNEFAWRAHMTGLYK